MSEGPQVKLRTQWLARHLQGRRADRILTERAELRDVAAQLSGQEIGVCACKGKHIFIPFGQKWVLHNHLLMRGKWRMAKGPFLFIPAQYWLVIETGSSAICNINGQVLEFISPQQAQDILARLGPDILADPYPRDEVITALQAQRKPVSEVILDQSVIAGIGNVAKSEALFLAGIDPRSPANALSTDALARLADTMQQVMQESLDQGGRWIHRVYQRHRQPCPSCGSRIAVIRMPPSKRSTYFCPRCQR